MCVLAWLVWVRVTWLLVASLLGVLPFLSRCEDESVWWLVTGPGCVISCLHHMCAHDRTLDTKDCKIGGWMVWGTGLLYKWEASSARIHNVTNHQTQCSVSGSAYLNVRSRICSRFYVIQFNAVSPIWHISLWAGMGDWNGLKTALIEYLSSGPLAELNSGWMSGAILSRKPYLRVYLWERLSVKKKKILLSKLWTNRPACMWVSKHLITFLWIWGSVRISALQIYYIFPRLSAAWR